jgi:hypothetical protein
MKIPFLVFAFVPAGAMFALRAYLKAHPPDSSEVGIRGLQRGLKIGAVSATAIPLVYILFYFRPINVLGTVPYLVCAVAGNIVNLAGLVDCLRELSGESLFAALLLVPTQLLWMWYAFTVLMAAN